MCHLPARYRRAAARRSFDRKAASAAAVAATSPSVLFASPERLEDSQLDEDIQLLILAAFEGEDELA